LSHDLRVEQFKALRNEMGTLDKDSRTLQIYVTGALVAYYSWLIANCLNVPGLALQWLLPMALPILGRWRTGANLIRMRDISAYIIELEEDFAKLKLTLGPQKGWEHFVKGRRKTHPVQTQARRLSHAVIWVLLIAMTFGAASFGPTLHTATCAEKLNPGAVLK
jgi:hypothetical protein